MNTPNWTDLLTFLVVCMCAGALYGLALTAQAPVSYVSVEATK